MTHAVLHLLRMALAWRSLAAAGALVTATSMAHATNDDEVVSGDFSGNPADPRNIGPLTPGTNRISGTTVPSGTFDTTTHSYPNIDNEHVTFTVPAGEVVSQTVRQCGVTDQTWRPPGCTSSFSESETPS
jgi:hypothetical protein